MKITITRSFSRKYQIRQYEPIDIFCAATQEWETESNTVDLGMETTSKELDDFCQSEVAKSLAKIQNLNKVGDSKIQNTVVPLSVDFRKKAKDVALDGFYEDQMAE